MNDIRHVCIITYDYPTEKEPYKYTFLDKLVCEFADNKINCTVIYPVPLLPNKIKKMPPIYWEKETAGENKIKIFSPRYKYFFAKQIFNYNTGILTYYSFKNAVKKVLKKTKLKPDCIYAHFVFPAGVTATKIGTEMNIPAFFAYGESTPWGINIFGEKKLKEWFKYVTGIIAVSNKNKKEILDYDLIESKKIKVFPNAVDCKNFYPRDKYEMRKKYKFKNEDFIVGYVGRFNESKGINRLLKALENQNDIKVVLIGGGNLNPHNENIIFKGYLSHEQVPQMLSACDLFVLPTRNEGCSNAILEAMACGLPIISSDLPFNDEILDINYSIKINPDNIQDIKRAITILKNDTKLRKKMSNKALNASKKFDIKIRAQNILNWMKACM